MSLVEIFILTTDNSLFFSVSTIRYSVHFLIKIGFGHWKTRSSNRNAGEVGRREMNSKRQICLNNK